MGSESLARDADDTSRQSHHNTGLVMGIPR